MKKGVKITIVSLSSFVGLLLIMGSIALCTILSSPRLTKLVNKQAPHFLSCDFSLKKANLTLLRTFPKLGLDIHELTLINPLLGSPSDTLLHVNHCTLSINLREFLKNDAIVVHQLALQDGFANLFVDPMGRDNYHIIARDTSSSSTDYHYSIDLQQISTKKLSIRYHNLADKMMADLQNIGLSVKGKMDPENIQGNITLGTQHIDFKTLDTTQNHICTNNLRIKFKGNLSKMDQLQGQLSLKMSQLEWNTKETKYISLLDIALSSGVGLTRSNQQIQLHNTQLTLNDQTLMIDGTAQRDNQNNNILLNLQYSTKKWDVQEILALIPSNLLGNSLDGLHFAGKIGLTGRVHGTYNETQMPIITADIDWQKGAFAYDDFPLHFQKINTLLNVHLDLNNQTDVLIKSFDSYSGKNHFTINGTIEDILGEMRCDVALNGDLQLADFKEFLPESLTRCSASTQASIHAQFNYQQITNLALDQIKASGDIVFNQLDLLYNDSIKIESPKATIDIQLPLTEQPYQLGEWIALTLKTPHLHSEILGLGDFTLQESALDFYINPSFDNIAALKMGVSFSMSALSGATDTLNICLNKPSGSFIMRNSQDLSLQYLGETIIANAGSQMSAEIGNLSFNITSHYQEKESNPLMRWNPDAQLQLSQANLHLSALPDTLKIPSFISSLTTKQCTIEQGDITLGNSDFNITGTIGDMDKYFRGENLMVGQLDLRSNYIDINQIMNFISGFGVPDSVMQESPTASTSDPFMVPYGMDIRMNTHIKKALFEDATIRNIGGNITLKDGVLVLDEMGLTSDAATLQLTALYKSPRKNHLFLGLDFHLLDIKIDHLIKMIPEVDTILPMLKSFAGNAEFHFALETNLKSNYDIKYSTLRGAAAINGENLVVLDEETYHKISKLLRFKKGTTNKIDNLSAEMTIFKNEIDVYPFSISIDKYQAILSGRHNLDMTYNYNISLLKPIQLGLDIIGTDKRKFKVGKAKYATLFKPTRQGAVEQNILQLKQQINQALKNNVRVTPAEQP